MSYVRAKHFKYGDKTYTYYYRIEGYRENGKVKHRQTYLGKNPGGSGGTSGGESEKPDLLAQYLEILEENDKESAMIEWAQANEIAVIRHDLDYKDNYVGVCIYPIEGEKTPPLIRLRKEVSLHTTAHEIGHALDYHHRFSRKWSRNATKKFRQELDAFHKATQKFYLTAEEHEEAWTRVRQTYLHRDSPDPTQYRDPVTGEVATRGEAGVGPVYEEEYNAWEGINSFDYYQDSREKFARAFSGYFSDTEMLKKTAPSVYKSVDKIANEHCSGMLDAISSSAGVASGQDGDNDSTDGEA